MHDPGHHASQGSNSSTSVPRAALCSANSTSPHCSYQQTLPLHYAYSYLLSFFCIAVKHKWINSLSHPYLMSSSLAKITMALALGVSRSCLIILSKSMVLSLRSWGIFRDWAMQSPPVQERRKGLCQRRAQERQWETHLAGKGAWEEERLSHRIAALLEPLILVSSFLKDSYNYFFAWSSHWDTHSLHAWVGSWIKQMGKTSITERKKKTNKPVSRGI